MNVEQIAARLVELCRAGKFEEAQKELYANDALSIESEGTPMAAGGPAKGLEAIYEKGRHFNESIEAYHSMKVSDALIADNWFCLTMELDVTMKQYGRQLMKEICVYHVRDGKIDREQFFYDAG